jgi:hypothetical protein
MIQTNVRQALIDALHHLAADPAITDFNVAFRGLDELMTQMTGHKDPELSAAFKEMTAQVTRRHTAQIAELLQRYDQHPPRSS